MCCIQSMEESLILPIFRKLRFVDCNKPFWKKLMYKAFVQVVKSIFQTNYSIYVTNAPPVTSLNELFFSQKNRLFRAVLVLFRQNIICAFFVLKKSDVA